LVAYFGRSGTEQGEVFKLPKLNMNNSNIYEGEDKINAVTLGFLTLHFVIILGIWQSFMAEIAFGLYWWFQLPMMLIISFALALFSSLPTWAIAQFLLGIFPSDSWFNAFLIIFNVEVAILTLLTIGVHP
ncbi:MAG: hypothetical protein AAFU64_17000, partial [Bacteroidota bacterium]